MKKLFAIAMAAALMATALVGCAAPAAPAPEGGAAPEPTPVSTEPIKIGVFEPMTGGSASGGALELEGVQLAASMRDEVLGRKVEIVVADNKSDKVEAATAASRLVEKDKVTAIIGSWGSSFSIAAGDIVKTAQVPAVGASCTNPLVTQGNEYYFRVCFIDPYQGKVMANYAFKNLGAKTAGIIKEVSNDYAIGLSKFFTDAFIELTGNPDCIVAEANYNTGDQDFNAQITNVAQKNPDVIFAPGVYAESAMVIKQARQLGVDIPILGGDTWETPEFLSIGGDAVEGIVFSTFFDSNADLTAETKVFVDAYKAKYNGNEPAAVTALAYDAYMLILDAIERAGTTDGPALQKAIAETKGFEGAAGTVTLDENGDATKNAVIKTVKDGKFTYLDTVSAD